MALVSQATRTVPRWTKHTVEVRGLFALSGWHDGDCPKDAARPT